MGAKRFTYKQKVFIAEYIRTLNGGRSARKAGYKKPYEQAYENLRKPHIRAAIDKALKELAMPPEEVIARITEEARANVMEFFALKRTDGGGQYLEVDLEALKNGPFSHLVKGIKFTKHGMEIQINDPLKAQEILARHHGLLKDNVSLELNEPVKVVRRNRPPGEPRPGHE